MPEFAQFIALPGSDDTPEPQNHVFTFDLPDLDPQRTVVLMFKVSGPPGGRVKMTVNGAHGAQVGFELDSTFSRPRSWHEVVHKGIFTTVGNRLLVEPDEGVRFVRVTDIIVWYHRKTP